MSALLAKDYVLLSIDAAKHKDGDRVIKKLRQGHKSAGIPWMTVLDADGKELVTSDGPKGNIGCPIQPDEIAWFRTMLERTRSRLTDAELDTIRRANADYAERVLRPKPSPKPQQQGG